jgi:hypothetical protein
MERLARESGAEMARDQGRRAGESITSRPRAESGELTEKWKKAARDAPRPDIGDVLSPRITALIVGTLWLVFLAKRARGRRRFPHPRA